MADPKAEEKKIDETSTPKRDSELSDTDIEKVAGGGGQPHMIKNNPA